VQHDEKKFMKKNLMQEFRNDFQQLALYCYCFSSSV